MIIALKAIDPNPYRDLQGFPINTQGRRYRLLQKSLTETGYWRNVAVRPHPEVPGRYQLVYGHHRHAILLAMGLEEADFIIEEGLPDILMFDRMVRENLDYHHITISSALEAYWGFVSQIKTAFQRAGGVARNLPMEIRNHFQQRSDELFDHFDEVILGDIQGVIAGRPWSMIAGKFIKDIYGEKMEQILKIILERGLSHDFLDTYSNLSQILDLVKTARDNKDKGHGMKRGAEIIEKAAANAGYQDSKHAKIPESLKADLMKGLSQGRYKPEAVYAKVKKYIERRNSRDDDYDGPGNVYIMMMSDSAGKRFIKVGFTKRDVEVRRRELDVYPFEITTYRAVSVQDGKQFEELVHFSHKQDQVREKGEWYHYELLPIMEKHLDELSGELNL